MGMGRLSNGMVTPLSPKSLNTGSDRPRQVEDRLPCDGFSG